MSNIYNEAILEQLYDEAYEQLVKQHQSWRAYMTEDQLHNAAVELAKKRWADHD